MSVIDKGEGAPSCSLQTSNNEPPSSNTVDIPDDAKSAKFLPSESHLEIREFIYARMALLVER